ncbi:MAG TPA: HAMP domain-containing sensor histidine kinase, partial [Flavisolibacter sp.]
NFPTRAGNDSLHQAIEEISGVHSQTVNIYDIDGNLQITSAKDIYTPGVLSTKMNPQAYFHLRNLNQAQLVQTERVPDLEYRSLYMAIRNANNDTYAYLNVPSFSSADELNQEISNFLVTIINLNAFILLIAGVVALFITNRITRSFSIIGNKMKEVTLGKTNQEIEWNKNDEIGELVTQYNKMVRQLEESASALAKSEREGAWREMARQVAHEIKNPLTPMKLSIQYLQKAIQNNQPNVQDLTTNVASTLIEQIDHLSKIAADFSQFANIGNKRVESIDLHNVIGSLLDLFSTNPKVTVTWQPVEQPVVMQVDKTHMNRLFTNLLANAVDACSERQQCVVTITEKIIGNDLQVAISDNGDGIPQEMQVKIFTPNFTTKTSGTGLGLAMCKSIVEQAGGRIWFTTKEGVGTTFFVQLPLNAPSF